MANQKISELSSIGAVDNAADLIPIVDLSAGETKKITPTSLKAALALNNVDNTTDANKPVSSATQTALDAKQATLVSGTTIKTINSTSVLGSGNISVAPATAINATAIATGVVDNTEFEYLNGVTSAIQTQIDSKQATLVSATNIKTINSTSVLGSGNIAVEPTITATTSADYYRGDKTFAILNKTAVGLGNVDNTTDANKPVSTATQTALDAKTNKLIIANRQTASYTLVLTDADKLVEMNVATANNLTVPLNSSVAFSTGTQILLAQYGAGQTTVVATSGVTIRSNGGKLKLNVQYSGATLIKIATNEWYLFGDIAA
ncbi:hypothetical protein [Runella sp.]|uniref:hypothetical protein n=1 Tax=Runella sp. TaxID=1960881 RepID=UPI003015F2E8